MTTSQWANPAEHRAPNQRAVSAASPARLLSMLLLALSCIMVFGWMIRSEVLIAIVPGLPASSVSTALCFALVAASYLAHSAPRPLRAVGNVLAFTCIAIAFLTLVASVVGLPFVVEHLLADAISGPEFRKAIGTGMANNTAAVFVFSGGFLIVLGVESSNRSKQNLREVSSYFVLGVGAISLAGYVTGDITAVTWGSLAGMSLPTTLGTLMMGTIFLLDSGVSRSGKTRRFPLLTTAVLLLAAIVFDLYTPAVIEPSIAYIPLVFISLWFDARDAAFKLAGVCSGFVLFGMLAAARQADWAPELIVNRAFVLISIWAVAYLVRTSIESEHRALTDRVRFTALADSTPDAILTMSGTGTVLSFNAAAERMFGYEADEVVGQNIRMLMPEPYRSQHDGYLRHFAATGEKRVIGIGREANALRRDGREFPIDLAVSMVEDGGEPTFVGTIRDISARKAHEDTLRQALDVAARRQEELERSNRDLDEFAYIASHDLKEPVRGLYNHARFLQEDFGEILGDDGGRRIGRLIYLSQRMERLISDLFQVARLGNDQMRVVEADLNRLVTDVVGMLDHFLDQHNAEVHIVGALPNISCDATRVGEVFRNLITNGIKYNDSPRKLIEVGYVNEPPAQVADCSGYFFVRDNGRGIEPSYFEEIFRLFKRLQLADEKETGTGVGLTFVKKIVERHGGQIWLESQPGVGTTFKFTLAEPDKAESEERENEAA